MTVLDPGPRGKIKNGVFLCAKIKIIRRATEFIGCLTDNPNF